MLYTKVELQKSLFLQVLMENSGEEMKRQVWKDGHYYRRFEGSDQHNATYKYAVLYPEFSRIKAVSVGVFHDNDEMTDEVITLTGDEPTILKELHEFMEGLTGYVPAGFNVSDYSMPVLMKRMLINRMKLPYMLQIKGKKPWEIVTHDLRRDYQASSFDHLTLEAMAMAFDLPIPDLFLLQENEEKVADKLVTACEENLKTQLALARALCKDVGTK